MEDLARRAHSGLFFHMLEKTGTDHVDELLKINFEFCTRGTIIKGISADF